MIQFEELGFAVLICGSCDEFYGCLVIYCWFSVCRGLCLAVFFRGICCWNLVVRVFLAHWWKIVIDGLRCAFHGRCGG